MGRARSSRQEKWPMTPADPDPTGEHPAWTALVAAAKEWAKHMDQWERFRFETEFGTIYVSITMETEWPEAFDWVTPPASEPRG